MNQFLEKPLYQNHNDKQQNWLRSKKSKIIFSILIIIVIFGLGFFTGSRYRPSIDKITDLINLEKGKPVEVDFSLFWDVWLRVQNDYFNRKNLDPQQMVYEAISGMVRATGDPHTVFFDPEETKRFKEEIEGESFEGIGAEIGIRKGILTIIAPLEGSPAQKAGLRSGDKILKINDQFTVDLTVDEAISLIRGPKGSEIILTVVRDSKDTKEIIVKRDTIKIPIAQWEKKEKTAYIRLYSFTENSSEEFQKVAQQVLNSNIESIVLDLRSNPGGYLNSAIDIAEWFLIDNQVIVIEDYGDGNQEEHRSNGNGKLANFPMVVLIDRGSASASEILAGALRDNRGIKLIGENTFGKGTVQRYDELKGGSSLKITVAKWLLPSGQSINEEGIAPDIEVTLTEEDINNGRDPQLDKALEILK